MKVILTAIVIVCFFTLQGCKDENTAHSEPRNKSISEKYIEKEIANTPASSFMERLNKQGQEKQRSNK